MNATQSIEILNANKFMRSDEEAMNFDYALAELALHPNREYLPALYLVNVGCVATNNSRCYWEIS
ncbi:MAG: hypothetical protein HC941_23765 [Microcoleus sp. SU_5_3]|nr:hypothetical protein [Microcoleus sp. SU_5_3]